MTVGFRPLTHDDLTQLFEWVHREHVKRWWYPEDAFEAFAREYVDALEGRDPTDVYVIERDGREIGAIQTYLVADHPEWEELVQVGVGVAGVDLFIGETDELGRSLGPAILRTFLHDVVFARSDVHACVAGVEPANVRSVRAFEKAGFHAVREYVEEGRLHLLLRIERSDAAMKQT